MPVSRPYLNPVASPDISVYRYAYFHNLPHADLPYIKIPLHTVIKLTPKAYGCDEERYTLPIGAVDTHRPKPGTVTPAAPPTIGTGREYYTEIGRAHV